MTVRFSGWVGLSLALVFCSGAGAQSTSSNASAPKDLRYHTVDPDAPTRTSSPNRGSDGNNPAPPPAGHGSAPGSSAPISTRHPPPN